MLKILLILFVYIDAYGYSDAYSDHICFKGKINFETIDKVCFSKEQVESYKQVSKENEESLLEIKILNVESPLFIYSPISMFIKKIKATK